MKITAKAIFFLGLQFCGALLIGSVCLSPAQAQMSVYGDVSLQIVSPQVTDVGNGYGEYRALITNDSTIRSHRVEIVLLLEQYNSETVVKEVRRTVELAPQGKAAISLFVPMLTTAYGARVAIDGQGQPELAKIINQPGVVEAGDRLFGLLLSHKILKSDLTTSPNFEEGFAGADGKKVVATQSPEAPITEWSANWLSYARYDGIMVAAEELNAAPEPIRTALLRYVERGGVLMVVGDWQAPPQWQARRGFITNQASKIEADKEEEDSTKAPPPTPPARTDNVLTLQITRRPVPPPAAQANSPTDPRAFFIGFGTVIVTGSVDSNRITPNQWAWASQNVFASRPLNSGFVTLANLNQIFNVVEKFGVPVRGLFGLMLLFVILTGPVNLIWLARQRRKIWLLWTVPAISLLTCLAVTGFAVFSEGWKATSRTEALTILDETAHRATTIGWTAFYSPVTPSEGLHFSTDTEIVPQLPENWTYRRSASERTIDWTNDQHLDSGWISARVPTFFKLRKSEARRERLNIRREANGAVSLVNSLGAEISQIWWADAGGKIHTASNIPAGAQATLHPNGTKAEGGPSNLREAFNQDWLKEFNRFTNQPQTVLMPNCYLAVLNASPFVEEALKGVKTRKARNLVYGIGVPDQPPQR